MKKSFSLLISILLITLFSFLAVFILETKSIGISNLNNSYLQSQSKLHINFFKNYIKSLDLKNECLENISIKDEIYTFEAKLKYEKECQELNNSVNIHIFLSTKTKENSIRIHENFTITY